MLALSQVSRPVEALRSVVGRTASSASSLSNLSSSVTAPMSKALPKLSMTALSKGSQSLSKRSKPLVDRSKAWRGAKVFSSSASISSSHRAIVGASSGSLACASSGTMVRGYHHSSRLADTAIESTFARVENEGNRHGARNLGSRLNTILNRCPQQEVWVVERFGKFLELAEGGLHFYLPFVDQISYRFSLKEQALIIPSRSAITKDNVRIHCVGVLYYKIVDPKAAAYGAGDPVFALSQLAQTSLRSVIGRLTLDETFHERNMVNSLVVDACNDASKVWGITCLRHEIREIQPPENVLHAMERQMEAERRKRVDILQSEGEQQALINRAEAHKREMILNSEAQKLQDINIAEGKAASTRIQAEAARDAAIAQADGSAQALERIASSSSSPGGAQAIQFELATQYIQSLSLMAKTNNTMIVPQNVSDVASMLTQATTIYQKISDANKKL